MHAGRSGVPAWGGGGRAGRTRRPIYRSNLVYERSGGAGCTVRRPRREASCRCRGTAYGRVIGQCSGSERVLRRRCGEDSSLDEDTTRPRRSVRWPARTNRRRPTAEDWKRNSWCPPTGIRPSYSSATPLYHDVSEMDSIRGRRLPHDTTGAASGSLLVLHPTGAAWRAHFRSRRPEFGTGQVAEYGRLRLASIQSEK